MKIIANSLRDVSTTFENFALSLSGSNYCVDFEIRIFKYQETLCFSLPVLKKLYDSPQIFERSRSSIYIDQLDKPITGEIIITTFDQIKSKIKKEFLYNPEDPKTWKVDIQTSETRQTIFWNLVKKYIKLPPTHSLQHIPSYDSFFNGGIMWKYCYILLNDDTKEGILLAGMAYD